MINGLLIVSNVINWLNNIENKKRLLAHPIHCKIILPSGTEEILEEVISFAKSLIDIDDVK